MGYLYNEIIECRNKKLLKHGFAGLLSLMILDTFATTLLAFRNYSTMLLLAGIFVFLLVSVPAYFIWVKTNRRYKYSIIDNELIIERLNSDRRHVLLNINLKTIERLERIDKMPRDGKKLFVWKRCSFMEKKNKGYLCLYKLSMHCICQDFIDAPEGTYCYMNLYYKEIEGENH
jgi:hypothetical protein